MKAGKALIVVIPVIVLFIGLTFFYSAYSVSQTTNTTSTVATNTSLPSQFATANGNDMYILVGGQNGSWFTASQYPLLYQVFVENHSARKLNPVPGTGAIWSGSWNGSDWFISGYGFYKYANSPNPFLYLFNGNSAVNTTVEDASESEWSGGDIFGSSTNGTDWFVSGLGSGVLPPAKGISNHYSAGLFNGTTFIDLTSNLPQQNDAILYANAFNGSEWLVGGGWEYIPGVLFSFNGKNFTDLTSKIMNSVYHVGSVQSIAWNGKYWLIGGVGFLAMYNGSKFTDLTSALDQTIGGGLSGLDAVNSIVWNGTEWLLGGGLPVAVDDARSVAWLASYNSANFSNLTPLLPKYALQPRLGSSVLSIAANNGSWFIGGYADNQSMLLTYDGNVSDISSVVSNMSYVNWVGAAP